MPASPSRPPETPPILRGRATAKCRLILLTAAGLFLFQTGAAIALDSPAKPELGWLSTIETNASLTQITQLAYSASSSSTQNTLRGDVVFSLPAATSDKVGHSLLMQLRAGHVGGSASPVETFADTNAAIFEREDNDQHSLLLAQAWYQLSIPLPAHTVATENSLLLTVGKVDPFLFFDQNSAADDETTHFINSALVHNSLLDAGSDIGTDHYGFSHGVHLAFRHASARSGLREASIGLFRHHNDAYPEHPLSSYSILAQLDLGLMLPSEHEGRYRLYGWHNPRARRFANEAAPRSEIHRGIGLSLEQPLNAFVSLFVRAGKSIAGAQCFDRSVTTGLDIRGHYWNRHNDSIGFAHARLKSSAAFSRDAPALDADADGVSDFGWNASGTEAITEIYYRMHLNKHFEIGPDIQYISRPSANPLASDLLVTGLRILVSL